MNTFSETHPDIFIALVSVLFTAVYPTISIVMLVVADKIASRIWPPRLTTISEQNN